MTTQTETFKVERGDNCIYITDLRVPVEESAIARVKHIDPGQAAEWVAKLQAVLAQGE